MKLYRSSLFEDLNLKGGTITVSPKSFKKNQDSTIPDGNWSFWFKNAIALGSTQCVVEANFIPEMEGIMRFQRKESYLYCEYQIEEFVTSKEVQIEKIWVNKLFSMEGVLSLYKKECTKKWGEQWVDKNMRSNFPHLTEGERYYWGDGQGQRLRSFNEVLSNKYFNIGMYDILEVKKRSKYENRELLSLDLFNQQYKHLYAGDTENMAFVSQCAKLVSSFETEDYY